MQRKEVITMPVVSVLIGILLIKSLMIRGTILFAMAASVVF